MAYLLKFMIFISLTMAWGSCHSGDNPLDSNLIAPVEDYSFKDPICRSKYNGFYNRFGFVISNYYEVIDFKIINLSDTVAILSPIILTPTASTCRTDWEKVVNNRLLVINHNGGKKVYDNVISNEIGMGTSGCELIDVIDNGFKLCKVEGQFCKQEYCVKVTFVENAPFVSEIITKSDCQDNPYDKTIVYKNLPLLNYTRTMMDSISMNF